MDETRLVLNGGGSGTGQALFGSAQSTGETFAASGEVHAGGEIPFSAGILEGLIGPSGSLRLFRENEFNQGGVYSRLYRINRAAGEGNLIPEFGLVTDLSLHFKKEDDKGTGADVSGKPESDELQAKFSTPALNLHLGRASFHKTDYDTLPTEFQIPVAGEQPLQAGPVIAADANVAIPQLSRGLSLGLRGAKGWGGEFFNSSTGSKGWEVAATPRATWSGGTAAVTVRHTEARQALDSDQPDSFGTRGTTDITAVHGLLQFGAQDAYRLYAGFSEKSLHYIREEEGTTDVDIRRYWAALSFPLGSGGVRGGPHFSSSRMRRRYDEGLVGVPLDITSWTIAGEVSVPAWKIAKFSLSVYYRSIDGDGIDLVVPEEERVVNEGGALLTFSLALDGKVEVR